MLQGAWVLGYPWTKQEPSQHHIAMPVLIPVALLGMCPLRGWTDVAGILALPSEVYFVWGGLLQLQEQTSGTVRYGFSSTYALLRIAEPKRRFTRARHQSGRVHCPDLVELLELCFAGVLQERRLWFSPQTFRARFRALLSGLDLPANHRQGLRCLDLGSLCSGGATYIISAIDNGGLCRRVGRWASAKILEVHAQEVMALQYMKYISSPGERK